MEEGTIVRSRYDRMAEREGRIGIVVGRTRDGRELLVRMRGTDGVERVMAFPEPQLVMLGKENG